MAYIPSTGAISLLSIRNALGVTGTPISISQYIKGATSSPVASILPLDGYGGTITNTGGRGYFGGGLVFVQQNVIDGIQFSNETSINPVAVLAVARRELTGVNSTTRGYFAGGTPGSGVQNEIDGIQFSNEAAINPAAALAVARRGLAGVHSTTRGYFAGGFAGSGLTTEIDGIQFSNEAAINPAAALVLARNGLAGVHSTTRGYFAGGRSG
jgi:hypothetical protein